MRGTVRMTVEVPLALAPLVLEFAQVQRVGTPRALGMFIASHRRELQSVVDAYAQARAIREGEGLPLLQVV